MAKFSIEVKLFIAFLLIGLISYSPVIFQAHPANPDAQYIIPTIVESTGPLNYVDRLVSFQTLDFQPVRDLSLYIDLAIFEATGFHVSIIHNLLLWSLSGVFAFRILSFLYPAIKSQILFIILSIYLTYPLFSQTIAWGVSRKHILAYLFTLVVTERWLKNSSQFSFRNFAFITLIYSLAIFSQPIALLWPLWALIYSGKFKDSLKLLSGSLGMMVITIALNFLYYSKSPLFLTLYSSKTNELQEIADKLLALGHYTFQLFFPYLLSLSYSLGHWSTLAGIVVLVLALFLMVKFTKDRKRLFHWLLFALLPLGIVLTKSTMLYDTYLLIPAFGILVLLCSLKKVECPGSVIKGVTFLLLPLFMGLTIKEATFWKSDLLLSQRNFENRPDCRTAYDYLMTHYQSEKLPSSAGAKNFLYQYDCGKQNIGGTALINLQSYMLYYEQDLNPSERKEKLKKLSELGVLPSILYAAFLIRGNSELEARAEIKNLIIRFGNTKFLPVYIPLADKVLKPFCQKENDPECTEFLKVFTTLPTSFQYK